MSLIYNHFFPKAIGLSKFFAFLSNFFLGFVTFLSQKIILFLTYGTEICRFWLKFATFRDRFRWCIYTKISGKWGTFFKKSIPTWNNSVIFATISKHFRNRTVRFDAEDRGWRHPKTAKSSVKPSLHWLFLGRKDYLAPASRPDSRNLSTSSLERREYLTIFSIGSPSASITTAIARRSSARPSSLLS